MKNAHYGLLLFVMLTPSLLANVLSADQVTWFAHTLIFVPGYDYFQTLATRHASEELVSTGVTLLCSVALFVVCLASSQVRSRFVRMRSDHRARTGQRARWSITSVRTRLFTLAMLGLIAFAWMCPNFMLDGSGGGISGALGRFFDGNLIGQGIYFCGLAWLTVSGLLIARLVFVPGAAASEAALRQQDLPRQGR